MPTGRGHASALLSKVNSQLRGERVPLKTREEDELAVYLNAINAKTQQVQSANFEDLGDISISSGKDGFQTIGRRSGQRSASPAGVKAAGVTVSPAASKFLKKKSPQPTEGEIVIAGRRKEDASPSRPERSSAINKFNALTSKIQDRRSDGFRRVASRDSDSESEVGRQPGSADTSVGRDGRKFLKGRKTLNEDGQSERGSPSPQPRRRNRSVEKQKSSKQGAGSGSINKGEIARTLGNVYLTSEEESLAEFIQGLSVSESIAKRPQNLVAKKQQKWRKKTPSRHSPTRQSPSPARSRSPSPFKRQRTPSPFTGKLSRSASQEQDSDMMDSLASEIVDVPTRGRRDSASSDDPININLMDVTSLIPVTQGSKNTKRQKSKDGRSRGGVTSGSSTSLFKASASAENLSQSKRSRMAEKKKTVKRAESKSSVFESLGIMMVDDLVPADQDKSPDVDSDMSEIVTERSDPALRRDESESEIITMLGERPRVARRESPESRSISPPSEHLSSRSELKTAAASSYSTDRTDDESPTQGEGDYSGYTDSFESDSRTATQSHSVSQRSRRKSRRTRSYTDESYSATTPRRRHKVVVEQREVKVTHGDSAQWGARHTGVTVAGPWGLQYTDPAPVATHVISADALETLTAYSPSVLALHEMMKTQVQLVKNFADLQKRIYQSCLGGIQEDFQYTTLEGTKEYIRKNKKPKMTFKEALELVKQEEQMRV